MGMMKASIESSPLEENHPLDETNVVSMMPTVVGETEATACLHQESETTQECDNVLELVEENAPLLQVDQKCEKPTENELDPQKHAMEGEIDGKPEIAAANADAAVATEDLAKKLTGEERESQNGAETKIDEMAVVSKKTAVVEKTNVELMDTPENELEEQNKPQDDLPLVERGIDDSPSDELVSPRITVAEMTTKAESLPSAVTERSKVAVEDPEEKLQTKLLDASSVMLASRSAPTEPTNKSDMTEATNNEAQKSKEEMSTPTPSLTFAQAFGSPPKKPPPIEAESKEKESRVNSTPHGLTFAQAFGSSPVPPVSPLDTPASVNRDSVQELTPAMEPLPSVKSTGSSHSALSASKNKKVQSLMSKYMEEVAHEPLPGDAIPIHRRSMEQSPAHSLSNASQDTPLSAQSIKKKIAVTEVELAQLPNITSVRSKFETSSRSDGPDHVFEFGESFRQKKRFEQLSDKERQREAKVALHGFNESDLHPGKVASGEIDTSSLGNVFTFEMSANASMDLPPDGTCRVDYKKADYTAMVFVVHRTRGMLLLHVKDVQDNKSKEVPGGIVQENEFLEAAQKSGSGSVQLQIAAREAAARQLFENTGLDIRNHVHRFKPAILRLNPPVDARGVQYLKNEYNNRLYYFLQVDEDDFVTISEADQTGTSCGKLTRPSEDPGDCPLALRLRDNLDGFTFVLDPLDAAKILKENGNKEATLALRMIMKEASEGIRAKYDNNNNTNNHDNSPDAKATEYSVDDSAPDDEKDERSLTANTLLIRTVGEKNTAPSPGDCMTSFHDEAVLKQKASADTIEHVDGVKCCCGWW
jgi:8-oxo-dGTP pyrophosphatase MutT (NUDIX family)